MSAPTGGDPGAIAAHQGASAPAATPIAPESSQAHQPLGCGAEPPGPSNRDLRAVDPSSGDNRPTAPQGTQGLQGLQGPQPNATPAGYGMDPLIRGTLVGLYLALVLPLPALASGGLRALLAVAVPLGLVLVLAITSETVTVTPQGLALGQPSWCGWWLRRGWSLGWNEITGLTPVATSQGGRVYYLRSAKASYLLPQRLARFADFLAHLQHYSGLDTSAIGRISPPWTYQVLAGLTALMLLGELAALGLHPAANLAP